MPLKDYQDIVGSTAAVVTIAQFFSPLFICKKIVAQGNTNNVDATPFVGGIGIGLLFLRHGYLLNDPAMIPVNLFAIGLNMIYFLIFLAYSDCRGTIITNLVKSVIGACALVSYTFLDSNNERVLTVYGTMVTGLMFALIAAPLKDLKEIIKNQDTGSLPFPMILSGTIVMSLWFLYGVILENVFIVVQNGVGLLLSAVQLSLFVIYPSKPTKKDD
ncbi:hypothetical protein GE061_014584, partial [Apolygus lucorum]